MNQGIIAWSPGVSLEEIEVQVIVKALKFYGNNKTATANALKIAVRTLENKLEKYQSDQREREKREAELRVRDTAFLARQRGPQRSITGETLKEPQLAGWAKDAKPAAGPSVEPASKVSTERPVSLPKPQEVQKVLPGQASYSGTRKNR